MKETVTMRVIAFFGGILLCAMVAITAGTAYAQIPAMNPSEAGLGPRDTYFVTQTSLATPFQVDAGRLAQQSGGTEPVPPYGQLMGNFPITAKDALVAL